MAVEEACRRISIIAFALTVGLSAGVAIAPSVVAKPPSIQADAAAQEPGSVTGSLNAFKDGVEPYLTLIEVIVLGINLLLSAILLRTHWRKFEETVFDRPYYLDVYYRLAGTESDPEPWVRHVRVRWFDGQELGVMVKRAAADRGWFIHALTVTNDFAVKRTGWRTHELWADVANLTHRIGNEERSVFDPEYDAWVKEKEKSVLDAVKRSIAMEEVAVT